MTPMAILAARLGAFKVPWSSTGGGGSFSFQTITDVNSNYAADGTTAPSLTGYRVYYSQTQNFDWTTASFQDFGVVAFPLTVTTSFSGTVYYRISSKSSTGTSYPDIQYQATAI